MFLCKNERIVIASVSSCNSCSHVTYIHITSSRRRSKKIRASFKKWRRQNRHRTVRPKDHVCDLTHYTTVRDGCQERQNKKPPFRTALVGHLRSRISWIFARSSRSSSGERVSAFTWSQAGSPPTWTTIRAFCDIKNAFCLLPRELREEQLFRGGSQPFPLYYQIVGTIIFFFLQMSIGF